VDRSGITIEGAPTGGVDMVFLKEWQLKNGDLALFNLLYWLLTRG